MIYVILWTGTLRPHADIIKDPLENFVTSRVTGKPQLNPATRYNGNLTLGTIFSTIFRSYIASGSNTAAAAAAA